MRVNGDRCANKKNKRLRSAYCETAVPEVWKTTRVGGAIWWTSGSAARAARWSRNALPLITTTLARARSPFQGNSWPHGVRCSPAPIRGAGCSSRTWNTPPATSTLDPTHHRATKALASVASAK